LLGNEPRQKRNKIRGEFKGAGPDPNRRNPVG
jgi:hypothetical protein